MQTEFLNLPYDENALSAEEVEELERFAMDLFYQLENKMAEMGLTMTDSVITKFSQEELEAMPVVYRDTDGKYRIKETEPSFIDDLMDGKATFADIDKYVEYWHTHDTGRTLQDFLGLTDEEFEEWGKSSDLCLEKVLENASARSAENACGDVGKDEYVKE